MEPLILVGVLLLFSILDGIARKQKQEAQRREGQGPGPAQDVEAGGAWERARPAGASETGRSETTTREPSSSEGLIPRDIWEEITALARGEVPGSGPSGPVATQPRPRPEPAARTGQGAGQARPRRPKTAKPRKASPPATVSRVSAPDRVMPSETIHALHPELGHDMSERLSRLDRPRDHRPHPNPDAGAALGMLRTNRSTLRQSLILKEILGPPVALRGDDGEDL